MLPAQVQNAIEGKTSVRQKYCMCIKAKKSRGRIKNKTIYKKLGGNSNFHFICYR